MNKNSLIIIVVIIVIAGLGIGGYFLLKPECPASCDDANSCTKESCSKETDYKCKIDNIPNCCGNKTCELEESYGTCPTDCPNCDDNNECTKDSYDYHGQKCTNAPILDVICCGNTACEVSETYINCSRDCPNCDDANKCTKDSYDYHQQKCLNEIIIPCCGNGICDKGAEAYLSCPKDCPSCDDNNKLTTDSFNYTTQKCENIVTHYFIDDFEAGSQGWDFRNAVDGGPNPSAWTLVREGSNTVLRGVDHNFADISGEGWDNYILKLKFKIVRGSAQINFRNNFFTNDQPAHRYIIRLEEGGDRLVLAKGSDEQKAIYKDLQESSTLYRTGWHTLEVRSYQDIINIHLDGNLLIKYKDVPDPILKGKVNFETGDDTEFLFDNVEIKLINAGDIIYP